jgi:hypothetical protein
MGCASGERSTLVLLRLGRSLRCGCGRSAVAGMCKRPWMPQVMRFTYAAGASAGALTMGAGVGSLGFAEMLV